MVYIPVYLVLCKEWGKIGKPCNHSVISSWTVLLVVSTWLKKGSRGSKFNGDTFLTIKLLLPGFVKRVYNINSKQLVKLFSQVRTRQRRSFSSQCVTVGTHPTMTSVCLFPPSDLHLSQSVWALSDLGLYLSLSRPPMSSIWFLLDLFIATKIIEVTIKPTDL